MIRIIRDRCGKEIMAYGKTGYLAWNFRAGHGGKLIGNNVLEDRDYCESCMGTIFDFIDRKTEGTDLVDAGMEDMASFGEEGSIPEKGDCFRENCAAVPGTVQSDSETAADETENTEGTGSLSGSSAAKERKFPRQQVRGPRKNSVDIGRILALREAGWSFGRIADDMGLSKQSVCNAFSRWKKAQEGQEQPRE